MSFRLIVILGIALVETLILVALVWTSIHLLEDSNERAFVKRVNAETEALAMVVRDAVIASDIASLEAFSEHYMAQSGSLYLKIRDTSRTLVDFGLGPAGDSDTHTDTGFNTIDDGVYDLRKVIYVDDFAVGSVETGISSHVVDVLVRDARQRLIIIAVLEVLVVATLSWFLGALVFRDMDTLRRQLEHVTIGGKGKRLKLTNRQEFNAVAHAFNRMADALEEQELERDRALSETTGIAQTLAQREQRLELLLDTVTDGVLITDQNMVITESNHSAERKLNLSDDQLKGLSVGRLLESAQDREQLQSLLCICQEAQERVKRFHLGKVEVLAGQNSRLSVDLTVVCVRDPDGDRFVVAFRDLTYELLSHSEIQRQELLNEALSVASIDAIFVINSNHLIIETNPSAGTMLARDHRLLKNQLIHDVIGLVEGQEWFDQALGHDDESTDMSVFSSHVLLATRANGDIFPVSFSMVPVFWESERYITLLFRDLTEQKRAESSLLQAKEVAEKASLAKSDFLAHVTHEIRSPLNAVIGCIDLLQDTGLDASQKLFTVSAGQSAGALLSLVNNILDFARIESGTIELVPEPFNVVEVLDSVLDIISLQIRDRSIALASVIDPIVCFECHGDKTRFRQILLNLVDNAIKFTNQGGIVIRLTARPLSSESQMLVCSVSDTGIGIPDNKQALIFDAFTQVDSTDATLHGGSGLGLSICKQVVSAMNGRIYIESTPGKGSTFFVELPMAIRRDADNANIVMGSGTAWIATGNSVLEDALVQQLYLLGVNSVSGSDLSGFSTHHKVPDWLFVDDDIEIDESGRELIQTIRNDKGRALLLVDRRSETPLAMDDSERCFDSTVEKPIKHSALKAIISQSQTPTGQPTPKPVPWDREDEFARHVAPRILIAEDSPANQLVVLTMLEQEGFECETAINGEDALKHLAEHPFDLVLMDVRMPRMDGLEATRRIRDSGQPYANIPIIALTANATHQDAERCRSAGMDDFLGKPFKREQLLAIIRNHVGSVGHAGVGVNVGTLKLMDEGLLNRLVEETSEAMVERMIKMFLQEIQRRVDSIHIFFEQEDCHGVEDEAHTLKSNAATFGAAHLSSLAKEVESACKRLDKERVLALMPEVDTTLMETLAVYRERFGFESE